MVVHTLIGTQWRVPRKALCTILSLMTERFHRDPYLVSHYTERCLFVVQLHAIEERKNSRDWATNMLVHTVRVDPLVRILFYIKGLLKTEEASMMCRGNFKYLQHTSATTRQHVEYLVPK